HIKCAQLEYGTRGWRLEALASIPRSGNGPGIDAEEVRRLADVLYRRGFTGNVVNLSVPPEQLLTANLELPPRSGEAPLDQIALLEFARSQKQEPTALEFSYWDLPAPARATRATHVMGVGCAHADAMLLLDAFDTAGLEVMRLDAETCALTAAAAPLMAVPGEITALLDIGWQSVRFMIVHQGLVSYRRSLGGYGVERLRKALADELGIPAEQTIDHLLRTIGLADGDGDGLDAAALDEARQLLRSHFDAVAAELATSLSYAAHQYPDAPVRRVLGVGGGAGVPGVCQHLARRLEVPTQPVQVSDVLDCSTTVDQNIGPSAILAIGLAQEAE
ncbi:MAG: pilus assembly protein PilM, partial [Tepidisphaeraceae bacterium]